MIWFEKSCSVIYLAEMDELSIEHVFGVGEHRSPDPLWWPPSYFAICIIRVLPLDFRSGIDNRYLKKNLVLIWKNWYLFSFIKKKWYFFIKIFGDQLTCTAEKQEGDSISTLTGSLNEQRKVGLANLKDFPQVLVGDNTG